LLASVKLLRGLLILAVIVAAIGAGIWWLTRPKPPEVTVYTVAPGTVEATVANTRAGTINANRRAKLAPPMGGQVERRLVHEGDRVEAGQVLIELWNEDLKAQLELSKRQVEQAEAVAEAAKLRAELADREAVRQQQLQQQNIASEDLVDRAVSGAKAAHADQFAAAAEARVRQAQIGTIQASLDRTVLKAPFAGVVAEINGEIGEFVTPSPVGIPTPPAVDLIDDTSLYVTAPIDEVDAAQVRVGMAVRVTLDAFGKRELEGKVRRIAPYVLDREKQARTVDVEVDLIDWPKDLTLLAGYSADAEILLQQKDDVLRVPSEAVRDGDKVLVVQEDGTLVVRTIQKGLANWRYTEVVKGLQRGERVVLDTDKAGVEAGAVVMVQGAAQPAKRP